MPRSILRLAYSCRDAAHDLLEADDRPLTRFERFSLRVHLALCAPCRRYRRQLEVVREATRSIARDGVGHEAAAPGLDDEARSRILEGLTTRRH